MLRSFVLRSCCVGALKSTVKELFEGSVVDQTYTVVMLYTSQKSSTDI